MKNLIIVISITFSICYFACNNSSEVRPFENALLGDVRVAETESAPGIVPANLSLYDITHFPETHTWEDIDKWYREELPKHEGKQYYNNLRQMLFYHLIEQFKLDEEGDFKSLDFYVNEQLNAGLLAEPLLFVRCLKQMEKTGNTKYLVQNATNKYRMDMALLEQQPSMKKVLLPKYEALNEYIVYLEKEFKVNKG